MVFTGQSFSLNYFPDISMILQFSRLFFCRYFNPGAIMMSFFCRMYLLFYEHGISNSCRSYSPYLRNCSSLSFTEPIHERNCNNSTIMVDYGIYMFHNVCHFVEIQWK